MRRVDDHKKECLWDRWYFIKGRRRKRLEKGWSGVFRRFLLEELPIEVFASHFDESMGRPTKELRTMAGVLLLQETLDLSDEEVTEALAFDERWHYALDIHGEGDSDKYVCERTVRTYREMAIEKGVDREMFGRLTEKLRKAFGVDCRKQRLDSTHIRSNMRKLRRGEIMARVIAKFLKNLRRRDRKDFENRVGKELAERYRKGEGGGCFSRVKPSEIGRTVRRMAEDLLWLVERFAGDEGVRRMSSYRLLERVLEEQCEVIGGEGEEKRVEMKKASEVAADTLQNPSDPDATYDKHKGQGYQVQIMETYQEEEGEENGGKKKPDLITFVDAEPAHKSDTEALGRAMESTRERGCQPEEILADGGYGSDANVERAAEEHVELIAPANKGTADDGKMHLEDFEIDEESGEVVGCPAGEKPTKTGRTPKGQFTASFDREKCGACPMGSRCPVRIGPRRAWLKPYTAKKMRLARRRAKERSAEFREKYRWRAGIEATMSRYKSQMGAGRLRVRGMRAVRYRARMKALGLNILRCAQVAADASKLLFSTYFGRRSHGVAGAARWLSRLSGFLVAERARTWVQ